MALYLKALTPQDGEDIFELIQRFPQQENGFGNPAFGLNREEFKAWLVQQEAWSRGVSLPEGRVPQIIFWLYDDDKPVGMCKLRTQLNEELLQAGGNIGYGIAPGERGKGYGKEQLRLVLIEARKRGLQRVLITANNDNKASIATALANGGIIEKVSEEEHYIWIEL